MRPDTDPVFEPPVDAASLPDVPVTRYGSPRLPLTAAGAVLRARAVRAGVSPSQVGGVDLAAACIAADAWMALTGAAGLDRPQQHGAPALAVAAALLARASGCGEEASEVSTWDCPSAEWLLALAEEHGQWALDLVGDDACLALERAAWDLTAGGEGTAFSAYAALLAITAQNLP